MREKKWFLLTIILTIALVLLFIVIKYSTKQSDAPEETTTERFTMEEIEKCLPIGYSIISNDLIYYEDVNNDDFEEVILIAKKKNKISEALVVLKREGFECKIEKQFETKIGAHFEEILIKDLNANEIPEIIITTAFTSRGNVPGIVDVIEWNDKKYKILFSEEAILFYDNRPEIESWGKKFVRDSNSDGKFEIIIPTEDSYKVHYDSPEIDYISFLRYNIYKWDNGNFFKANAEFIEIYNEELNLIEKFFKDEKTKIDDRKIILKHIEEIRDLKETSKVAGWKTYTDETVGFKIKHSIDLNIADPIEYFSKSSDHQNYNEEFMKTDPIIVFDLETDKFKGTNLEYAYLSMGVSKKKDILAKCLPSDLAGHSVENNKIIEAGNINFYKVTQRDKVSEKRYIDVASYNAIYDDTCYSIKGVICTKELTSEKIEEFQEMKLGGWKEYIVDEPEIFNKFEKVIESFSLAKNNNNNIKLKLENLAEEMVLYYFKNCLNNNLTEEYEGKIRVGRIMIYDKNSGTPKINMLIENIEKGSAINLFVYFDRHNMKFKNIEFLEEKFLEETKIKDFIIGPDVRIKNIDKDNLKEIIENTEFGYAYKWDEKSYTYKAINTNAPNISQTSFTVSSNEVNKFKCTEGKKELIDLTPPQQTLTITCDRITTNKDFDVLKSSTYSPRDSKTGNMYTLIKENSNGSFLIVQIRTTANIDNVISNYSF